MREPLPRFEPAGTDGVLILKKDPCPRTILDRAPNFPEPRERFVRFRSVGFSCWALSPEVAQRSDVPTCGRYYDFSSRYVKRIPAGFLAVSHLCRGRYPSKSGDPSFGSVFYLGSVANASFFCKTSRFPMRPAITSTFATPYASRTQADPLTPYS